MNYLLDTCILSELVKPEPNPKVIKWISSFPSDSFFLSALTIGEIRKGITKLPESKKKQKLAGWLITLLKDYKDRIYKIDVTVAENWGVMQGKAEQNGKPMSTIDSLIAATAKAHNLIIVTRNETDFQGGNIPVINPWDEKVMK